MNILNIEFYETMEKWILHPDYPAVMLAEIRLLKKNVHIWLVFNQ